MKGRAQAAAAGAVSSCGPPVFDDVSRLKQPSDSPVLVGVVFLLVLAVALLPLVFTRFPPLADYPNHLARMHILGDYSLSPELQTYYLPILSAQPNLAMDLVMPFLARFMPLELAGRVFIGLTLATLMAGTVTLHRTLFERWSLWPLAAVVFLYNRLLLWGFLGLLLTVGLSLFATATWIMLRDRGVVLRLLVNTLWSLIIFFGHLFAFGMYAIVVFGYELHRQYAHYRATKKFSLAELVGAGLPLLVPLVIFVTASPVADNGSIKWGPFANHIVAWLYPFLNYSMPLDVATAILVFGALLLALYKRKLLFSPAMAVGLALLAVVHMVMPDELFSSFMADRRIPVAFVFFGIASCTWRFDASRWRTFALTAFIAVFGIRMIVIDDIWAKGDVIYQDLLSAFNELPRGAKILDFSLLPQTRPTWTIPLLEAASYGVVAKDALVTSLYASPTVAGQTVAFKEPYATLAKNMPKADFRHVASVRDGQAAQAVAERSGFLEADLLACFDYMLVTHPEAFSIDVPARLMLVQRNTRFELYKILSTGQRCRLPAG